MNASDVLQALEALIDELESIHYDIKQYGLSQNSRDELEQQSGAISEMIKDWERDCE